MDAFDPVELHVACGAGSAEPGEGRWGRGGGAWGRADDPPGVHDAELRGSVASADDPLNLLAMDVDANRAIGVGDTHRFQVNDRFASRNGTAPA